MSKRLAILGTVLVIAAIIVAVLSGQADAAYAGTFQGRRGTGQGAPSNSGWILFWILAVSGVGSLLGAWVIAGAKPKP